MSLGRILMVCGLLAVGSGVAGVRAQTPAAAQPAPGQPAATRPAPAQPAPAGGCLIPAMVQPGLVPPVTTYWLGLVDSRTVDLRPGGPWPMPAVEVLGVWPGSPAAVAGIETGDIILAADGRRTRSPDDLRRALAASDSLLELTIIDVRSGYSTPVLVRLVPSLPSPPIPWPQPQPQPRPRPRPQPQPQPDPAPTDVFGVLRKSPVGGKAQVGGKPAERYQVLDLSGWTWTLDFQRRPDLLPVAASLIGRPVLATGQARPRPGPGIPEAQGLILNDLRPARGDGPLAEGRAGAK